MLYFSTINEKDCILLYYTANKEKPNISIPDKYKGKKIKYIKAGTFADKKSIGAVSFNKYIEEIGRYAFKGCIKLLFVKTSKSLRVIQNEAFSGCYSLKYIELYEKIRYIGTKAFFECISLECIKIPRGLKEINRETFYNCEKLREVHIPETVKKIHPSAFKGCNELIIYAPKGSYAQEFAKKQKIQFTEEQ